MPYKHLLKPILFRFDPEAVHDFFIAGGEKLGNLALGRFLIASTYNYKGSQIAKDVDGLHYRTPFLLAAGFDYNARLTNILPSIGLGGEEIGSVTARACAGNAKPRLKRLPHSQAIVVNKGLRNDGVDTIIERLKETARKNSTQQDFVKGISIARTNDNQSVSIEAGIADYLYSFRRLNEEKVGDYYTINISCPNAFGAEAFTDPKLLDQLLSALKKVPCAKPVYIKMPINLAWADFHELLKVIDLHGLQGVVIGNLNKDYTSLKDQTETPVTYEGGLSGAPCQKPSTELIRKTREVYGSRFTIIAAGGVMSPADALEKIAAGADLIQLITGLIYEGPGLVKKMCWVVASNTVRLPK